MSDDAEIDIVNRLRFDATRCELQFSRGTARNIWEAADEIERLREEVRHLRIDNARLRDNAAIGGLMQ